MNLTRKFRETVQTRARHDARFRRALLTEAVNALCVGEIAVCKVLLLDCINATQKYG